MLGVKKNNKMNIMSTLKRYYQSYKRRKYIAVFRSNHPTLVCDDWVFLCNNVVDDGISNVVSIPENSSLKNCNIYFHGSACRLELGENTHITNVSFWFEDMGGTISIGSNVSMETGCQFASVEGTSITIGDDCMFSHDVDVRSTDSHSITNEQGVRINPSEDIQIGNHVWIGVRSTILKGSVIPDNCIVGACSLVSSNTKCVKNSVCVGVPAKIVKTNINWLRERI